MINDYLSLSTRAGFNKSLGHFRMVNSIVKRLNQKENLADIVDSLEKGEGVEKSQIGPILNAIAVDRMGSQTRSFNLHKDIKEFDRIQSELKKWNRFDIVIAYHHPQLGISLINPKDPNYWETVRELNRDELVVCYITAYDEADKSLQTEALASLVNLLLGRPVSDTDKFGGATPKAPPPAPPKPQAAPTPVAPQAAPTPIMSPPTTPLASPPPASTGTGGASGSGGPAAPAPAAKPGGKVRMTPKYSIQVSNELFHNGNVEAWKNIVESYKNKYPGLEVHIFHDGQKVNNINSLFKWGKVKHGDVILFSVAGEEFKAIAKLQRYLYEGASIRFEKYLKKDVNKVISLF